MRDTGDRLVWQEDRNGRRITFNPDPSVASRTKTLVDSQSRTTTLTYAPGDSSPTSEESLI